MSKPLQQGQKTMGTFPVFMTAVSTILGAILFLKFGYSVGNVGLVTTMVIIIVGHLVTIPTAIEFCKFFQTLQSFFITN